MSTAAFWDRARELFHACAELPPAERRALLDACEDAEVRAEVESLLAQHDDSTDFLGQSVWEMAAGTLPEHIGPYRVVGHLGEGGMGAVFLAVRDDAQFEQRVAIKVVRSAFGGAELLRRFRRERQILAALAHPNIARLLDGGTVNGLPYLVMEYVEGTPIDVYCRDHALPIAARLHLFLDLCDAVQYAHRNLVIHRDIKPANVLVTADGVPKLLDFGIAKLTSEQVPADATVTRLMTPDYASPEQLDGRVVTTATDVYSLGVLLFEILTGRNPFAGRSRTGVLEAPRASTAAGQRALRGDLDRILMVALDPDPERRYGSVENLAGDVRRHLEGRPVEARGTSFGYRALKFVRRNKLGVGAAAAAMLVFVFAFFAVVQQKRIAERRFEQVRSLARSVVFDIHDAIAPLPGSTNARRLLVQRALVYLDALEKESHDNTPLEMELAGAYERVGDVQGMPYRPNLGDSAGALVSYRKAQAIAERVTSREPDDEPARALLADLHDRAGFIEQRALRYDTALRDHERARALRDALPHRGAAGDVALARTWVAIADCLYLSGNTRPVRSGSLTPESAYLTSLHVLERVPPAGAHRRDLLEQTARANQRLGGYYTNPLHYDPALALRHHEAALHALEEMTRLDPSDAVARRHWADHLVMMATLQNRVKDGDAALAGATRALAVIRDLAAADPNNVEAQNDLAFAYEQIGVANTNRKHYDEADAALHEALRIRQQLMQRDPTNREVRRSIAGVYGMLASASRDPAAAERYRAAATAALDALRN